MRNSRLGFRLLLLVALLYQIPKRWLFRFRNEQPVRRILIIHQLLLGDALMTTGLLAALRQRYPKAEITLAGPPFLANLYETQPYGVKYHPFTPKQWTHLFTLWNKGPFDQAYILLDNRYSWTALAVGCTKIIGYTGHSWLKDWPLNDIRSLPQQVTSITELLIKLSGDQAPPPYSPQEWLVPKSPLPETVATPYVLLHVGASTPLKHWPDAYWQQLAADLSKIGYQPLWTGGPGEEPLIERIDPKKQYPSLVGQLSIPQMWTLVEDATLLVCLDTGISHIAKHTFTPTVSLFGPGSPTLAGVSPYFSAAPFIAIDANPHCRDQTLFFKRSLPWVRQCKRSIPQCPTPGACMQSISYETVWQSCLHQLKRNLG